MTTMERLRVAIEDQLAWLETGEVDGVHYDEAMAADALREALAYRGPTAEPQGESGQRWTVHYEQDLGWRVIDADSDNGDLIADVDPENIATDLGKDASAYALLLAAAPELARAGLALIRLAEAIDVTDDEYEAAFDAVKDAIRAALRKAGAL